MTQSRFSGRTQAKGRGGGNKGGNRNSGRFQKNKNNNMGQGNNGSSLPSKKYFFHPNGAKVVSFHTYEDTNSHMLMALGEDNAFNTPHEVLESVKDGTNRTPIKPVAQSTPRLGNPTLHTQMIPLTLQRLSNGVTSR